MFTILGQRSFASVRHTSRQIREHRPCSLTRKKEFTNIFSEKIVTARVRHTSRRRRILTSISIRHRVQPSRVGIAVLILDCLVQLSNGVLRPPDEIVLSSSECAQRSSCRGVALASRLDPLILSDDKRGRSKALLFAVLNITFIPDSDSVSYSRESEPTNVIHQRHQ